MPRVSVDKGQLDRVEAAILGNGHEGLLVRQARMEETITAIKDDIKDVAAKAVDANEAALSAGQEAIKKFQEASVALNDLGKDVKGFGTKVDDLAKEVKAHTDSIHLAKLLKDRKFWAAIVGGYIVLHLIATYIPNFWDWIMLLVGLPKWMVPLP